MSRSYHVTKKAAQAAFQQGDAEPVYQASEKAWVKTAQTKARTAKVTVTSRAIVSAEIARTRKVKSLPHRVDK